MKRKCDSCKREYTADPRNIKRGWGLCCSKSCAASKREKSKPGYDSKRVERNNSRREIWNKPTVDENYYGVYRGKRTSEGYKVYEHDNAERFTAIDKFGDAIYDGELFELDAHPFDMDY